MRIFPLCQIAYKRLKDWVQLCLCNIANNQTFRDQGFKVIVQKFFLLVVYNSFVKTLLDLIVFPNVQFCEGRLET